jgi:uncharacterized membrane protein YfcA
MVLFLKLILGSLTCFFTSYYLSDVFRNRFKITKKKWVSLLGIGFVTNFFDTLGIGSFAQQTVLFKFFKLVDDKIIPGTMNVGNTIPTVLQAFVFMNVFRVEPLTLACISLAAPIGAVLGAGYVVRMSRRLIQFGLGSGLFIVAMFILAGFLGLVPAGGTALGISGIKLIVITIMSFLFGALQSIGIGFYAPCMAMVYAMGLHPSTAFPIMMTATGLLMAAGGARFIKENAYDRKAAISDTLAGIAGVMLAAFVVKSLSLNLLKIVVLLVVLYTSFTMFSEAAKNKRSAAD